MLFGGGARQVSVDDLERILNEAFDSKISGINAKASFLADGIDEARAMLIQACERFDSNDAKPDTEYMRAANVKQIMEQKPLYTSGLRRILGSASQAEAKNLYSSYHSRLESARSIMEEVLKLNNKFRPVLEAYSNELGKFKAGFSTMERYVKELGSRLESKSAEFNEYRSVLEEIDKLKAFEGELAALSNANADIDGSKAKEGQEAALEELSKRLSQKMAEINAIDRSIADVKANMAHVLSPLDKAARKYEHGMSKMYLTHYIEDPIGRLSGDAGAMSDFAKQAAALKKEIEENRISVKNRMEALQALEFILRGDMQSFLDEVAILETKRAPLQEEANDVRAAMRDMERIQAGKRKEIMAADELRSRIQKVAVAQEASTRKIEDMFDSYYKIQIKITV